MQDVTDRDVAFERFRGRYPELADSAEELFRRKELMATAHELFILVLLAVDALAGQPPRRRRTLIQAASPSLARR